MSETRLTPDEIERARRSANADLHPDHIGDSENLCGPFPCACAGCEHNRLIIALCDAADRAETLEADCEVERMRLAACMTAALGNTRDAVEHRITRENPYWSAAYGDVCRAVDAEIALREERDALAASLDRPPQGWQPIETAPKDGTTLLGYDSSRTYEPEEGLGAVEFMRWIDGAWRDPSTYSMRPTHWQPLPPAPSGETA